MKTEKPLGMFEAHDESIYLKLYYELKPYITNHYTSTEEQIFDAVCDFIEDDENQDHFVTKKTFDYSTEDDLVSYIQYIVKNILTALKESKYPIKKTANLVWNNDKTSKTKNGILVRHTKDGKFISLKTLTPEGIIMSNKDYKALCKEVNLEIDTLTSPELLRLITDYKTDSKNPYWKKFKTLKTFEESYLVELGIEMNTDDTHTTTTYELGKGFNKFKQKSIKKQDKTLSVFDFNFDDL
jgi:hypothetical protein